MLPPEGFDSPGAAELRIGSTALKYVVAVRTLQYELGCGVGPRHPTPMYTDSKTHIDGTDCERLVRFKGFPYLVLMVLIVVSVKC